jgi:hypothetical protein
MDCHKENLNRQLDELRFEASAAIESMNACTRSIHDCLTPFISHLMGSSRHLERVRGSAHIVILEMCKTKATDDRMDDILEENMQEVEEGFREVQEGLREAGEDPRKNNEVLNNNGRCECPDCSKERKESK